MKKISIYERSPMPPFFSMRYLRLGLTLCLGLMMAGCSHFQHSHNKQSHSSHSNSMHSYIGKTKHSEPSLNHTLTIELNNGKKWIMDDHTRMLAQKMQQSVVSLSLETQTQDQLKALGKQLGQDLDLMIQGCTMKGDAHNALHEFLTNFMPAVEHLKAEGQARSAERIHYLLMEYSNIFE